MFTILTYFITEEKGYGRGTPVETQLGGPPDKKRIQSAINRDLFDDDNIIEGFVTIEYSKEKD